ncbi:MAG TPA: UMP kinase [Dictyoglomaceae bacterium]|nr:UMP kinase [Dictyoglomaceae bacterium]HOL39799.1 UMP kinase [Dictyoglomaceae bacterium]HPP16214.1 UMP kinase [Dictyoglomaceae bacterium]
MSPKYKRILLKISGESFSGEQGFGLNPDSIRSIAEDIKEVHDLGIEIGVVVGGGNFFRGRESKVLGIDRVTADYMGMLATTINALALQDSLEKIDVVTRVQTGIEMRQIAEPFIRRKAIRHLEKGRVVIFAAGTGNPFFSTDTAAALRAAEIKAEVILKETKVDGVYNKDPLKHSDAEKFDSIEPMEFLKLRLEVLDATAVSLCMDNKIPIIVFNMSTRGNLKKVILGEKVGTYIGDVKIIPDGGMENG